MEGLEGYVHGRKSFCNCAGTQSRSQIVRYTSLGQVSDFSHELSCDCGEMSVGNDAFDWNFEGGEMTDTSRVREGSNGRGIDFHHPGGRL